MPRLDPAKRLLRMALLLAGSRAGLTLRQVSEQLDIEIRTVQRMRATLEEIFPALESVEQKNKSCGIQRWRLPGDPLGVLATPRPEALAAVQALASECDSRGEPDRAAALRELVECWLARLPGDKLRRAEPDIEALMEAEGTAMRPGPRPMLPRDLLPELRSAVAGPHPVEVLYEARNTPPRPATILPLGILRGGRGWLVAATENKPGIRLWRLDRIRGARVLDRTFDRPPDFDLHAYAARSFGVFQDSALLDVVLRIEPSAAADAKGWVFHPSQTVTDEADGALTVRFRAGGVLEMCWHFFIWGSGLTIVEPDSLRVAMAEMTAQAAAHHALR